MLADMDLGGSDDKVRLVLQQCGVDDPRGFELLFSLAAPFRLLAIATERHLQASGLSAPRLGILLWLYVGEQLGNAEGFSPSRLSEFQHISRNTVSSLLRSLEEQGLIERAICREDKRRFHIRLSPAGRDLACAMLPQQGPFLNDLFAGLTPDEQATLLALLDKLRQSLRSRVAGPMHPARAGSDVKETWGQA